MPATPDFRRCIVERDAALRAGIRPPPLLAELFSQHADAMYPYIAQRSVVIICQRDGVPVDLGAGTLVQVGGSLLVATAAHVVADFDLADLWILPFGLSESRRVPVLGRGLRAELDVAWLELDQRVLPEGSAWPRAAVADLCGGLAHVDDVVAVYGFPSDLLGRPPDTRTGKYGLVPFCLFGGTVAVAEWPTNTGGRPLDGEADLLIDYPNGVLDGDPGGRRVPRPNGISGGGVWNINSHAPGVWGSTSSKLIGIDTAWFEGRRLVRATQIQHWARCVAEDRPDLSAPLSTVCDPDS